MADHEPIFWRGELIGHVEAPRRYPAVLRGPWIPQANDHCRRFLEELRCGRGVWVEVGGGSPTEMARVTTLPGEIIELHLDVEDSPTLLVNPFKKDE